MAEQIRSYKDLEVWKFAISLTEAVYAATSSFPKDELFGMTSQMRRASVSIAANIAEGYGRDGTQSFIQFLRIAQGSLKELETHVVISERVRLLDGPTAGNLQTSCESVSKMLRNLIPSLEQRQKR